MSLVFAGSCTAFHHQYFKMVDILMHYFEQNMHSLNPSAKPYAPLEQDSKEYENNHREEESSDIGITKVEKLT